MIGKTISHYDVLEKLGQGGMGVVYKAEDRKLKRPVALKFLPDHLSGSPEELARFQQEAEAISALNHPSIATIYEIDEWEGRRFLALEFIPGGTLRQRLRALAARGEDLPINDAVSYTLQIAEGLAHAHRAQIVHRDIKSDNVMLTAEGRVKITDFGLAKLRGSSQLTKTGSTVGTLAYMAPEQIQGLEIDARADLFSLGVVLFELLTGRLPFRGEHEAAVMYSVLNEEPLPVEQFRPGLPARLRAVLRRALEKSPSARYQSADEMAAELRGSSASAPVSAAAAPVDQKSIVVLPFGNMSADKENEYFSDGLTEELIADLSKLRSLRVISRNSAMRLKGTTKEIRAIAQDLGVRYVLEGSVRKSGQSLRITAQLIDGATDANLWAEKYSGTLDDVFEIQEKVSRAIAGALKVVLSTDEERQMEARPIGDARAHDLYLRARTELQRGVGDSLHASIALLEEGLAIVGENEILYGALGQANFSYFRWISKVDERYLRRAKECLEKAFALNPASSHGFALQGTIHGSEGDIGAAIRSLRRAVAIDPSNAEALLWLTVFASYSGKLDLSRSSAAALLAIDPYSPIAVLIQGVTSVYAGEFEGSLPPARRGVAMDPGSPLGHWTLAIVLVWCGMLDEAIHEIDELARLAPGWVYTHHALFLKHGLKGDRSAALAYATPELALEAKYDLHFALHVAHCYALIGEKSTALDFLEHSVRSGMVNHPFLSRQDPLLESLRQEPRFHALMDEALRLHHQLTV